MVKIGGSGSKTTQTNTNSSSTGPDAGTQAYVQGIRNAAQGAAASGPGAPLLGASGFYTGAENAGQVGARAMGGDVNAVNQLMNPYQQNVINNMMTQLGLTNQQTTQGVNADATMRGAFGGSRAAVAQGSALSANDVAANNQIAQLLYSGYGQAMNQAGQAEQMGLQGAAGNTQLGMAGVGNPQLWQMLMLQGGLAGTPYGTTTQGTSGSTQSNVSGSAGFKLF